MGVDFLDRRVLAQRVVDGRKPASGHESQLRQGVASGHPQGRSAAKEPQSGLTRRNPLTFDPTCCGFSHSLFAIYARFYAAANNDSCGRTGPATTRVAGARTRRIRGRSGDGRGMSATRGPCTLSMHFRKSESCSLRRSSCGRTLSCRNGDDRTETVPPRRACRRAQARHDAGERRLGHGQAFLLNPDVRRIGEPRRGVSPEIPPTFVTGGNTGGEEARTDDHGNRADRGHGYRKARQRGTVGRWKRGAYEMLAEGFPGVQPPAAWHGAKAALESTGGGAAGQR